MTIKTPAEIKAKFETGKTPTYQDFVDLVDSELHKLLGNFPDPLPAVDGSALLNIGSALPNPLPALDGSALYNINPQEYNIPAGMPVPSYATSTTFVLTGDYTVSAATVANRVFLIGRRIRLTIGGVYFYTDVQNAVFATGTSTVTLTTAMPGSPIQACAVSVITPLESGGGVSPGTVGLSGLWPDLMRNIGLSATVAAGALTVALKTKALSDPSSSSPVEIAFRNRTDTIGNYAVQQFAGGSDNNPTIVVPSGATLGFTASEAGEIYVYAIDGGATRRIGVSKKAIFDESALQSTTIISTSSDSDNLLYSTEAAPIAAIRLIGRVNVTTGAVAGQWDNAPTRITLQPSRSGVVAEFTTSSSPPVIPAGSAPINVEVGDLVTMTYRTAGVGNATEYVEFNSINILSGTAVLETTLGTNPNSLNFMFIWPAILTSGANTQREQTVVKRVTGAGTISTFQQVTSSFGTAPTSRSSHITTIITRPRS